MCQLQPGRRCSAKEAKSLACREIGDVLFACGTCDTSVVDLTCLGQSLYRWRVGMDVQSVAAEGEQTTTEKILVMHRTS